MAIYFIALSLHLVGATIWAGGHLVLAFNILPSALKQKSVEPVLAFEKKFELLGLSALGTQFLTGCWLAEHILGMPNHWFANNPVAHLVQIKLSLLVLTIGMALDMKLRVIPKLSDKSLSDFAWHVRIVTFAAVLFVIAGASIRVGGYPVFN